MKAEQALTQWKQERDSQIRQRRTNNEIEEKQYHALIEEHRKGDNPWERVVDNINLGGAQAVSSQGKDMTRMKAAILARKADITKAGGMKNVKML